MKEGAMLLEGAVAVVTGGTRGIGLAIVQMFHDHGANVIAVGRTGDESAGDRRHAKACDVSREDEVEDMVANVIDTHGAIDILVNNAGIAKDGMIHRAAVADFDDVIRVNLRGPWLCTRAVLRHMRQVEGGGGRIVNVASIAGPAGNLGQSSYSASKAALIALTKTTAREGARFGVRANAILPGLISTDMTRALSEASWSEKLASIPLGRAGEPQEVASAALFLASSMSTYVTGTTIDVSGGRGM